MKPELFCAEDERDWLRQQLAASQARELQLREALVNTVKLFKGDHSAPLSSEVIKQQDNALALPSDTTAIETMIQKAGEVMRERCASFAETSFAYRFDNANAIRALPGVTLEDLK